MIDKNIIKFFTRQNGFFDYQIAEKIGMSPENYSRFIGKKNFSVNDLQKLADAIGVDLVVEFRPKKNGAGGELPGFIPEK